MCQVTRLRITSLQFALLNNNFSDTTKISASADHSTVQQEYIVYFPKEI
jgi:hypothetical protein